MTQRIRVLQDLGEEFERALAHLPARPVTRQTARSVSRLTAAASVLVVVGVTAVALVLLGRHDTARPPAFSTPRISTSQPRGVIGRPQGVIALFARGRSTRRLRIRAVVRREYQLTLNAPTSAHIAIRIVTPFPQPIRLALDQRTIHGPFCRTHARHVRCFWPFAAGGNAGGRWTVMITKISTPPATVAVSVVFVR